MPRRIVYRCKSCERVLRYNTVMCNHGICPYCEADSGGTIIEYTRKYEEVGDRPAPPWSVVLFTAIVVAVTLAWGLYYATF